MFEENEISKNANGGTEIAKRTLTSLLDPELLSNFQIISSRVRDLDYSKIRIFFAHDLPEDPESKKFQDITFRNDFHKFVFISNWQYQRYQLIHNIPYDSKSIVLESGIEPAPENVIDLKTTDKLRIVYTSTPQRGLDILVPVFARLAESDPNIHLDVFSSFKIYGWDDYDKQFEPLYQQIREHPQMTYHGFVPNQQLRDSLNTANIFAYPCTWLETSCRAMLESMSAGLVCIHPNYGALAETSGGLNIMYAGDVDKNIHAQTFLNNLAAGVNFIRANNHIPMIKFNKMFVDGRFGLGRVKNQWEVMLKDLLKLYPTVESRAKPKPMLVYRTS